MAAVVQTVSKQHWDPNLFLWSVSSTDKCSTLAGRVATLPVLQSVLWRCQNIRLELCRIGRWLLFYMFCIESALVKVQIKNQPAFTVTTNQNNSWSLKCINIVLFTSFVADIFLLLSTNFFRFQADKLTCSDSDEPGHLGSKGAKRRAMNSYSTSVTMETVGSKQRSTLTLSKMLSLNAVVCGIEFCGSAAFCFIPPMLLKAGIGEQNMSMILGIGPLIGLFLVPIIGRSSDKCNSRFGRRRPYIFGLSMLLLVSLIILVFAKHIGLHIFGGGELGRTIMISLLVLGSIILDFTCQSCLTPCEALLSDTTKDTDQHGRCFTVYSFMVSFGGCVGYLITALDWSENSIGVYFGSQESSVFIMLIILYSFSLLMTLEAADETPLYELQKQHQLEETILTNPMPVRSVDPGYVSDDLASDDCSNSLEGLVPSKNKSPRRILDSALISSTCNIPLTRWSFTSFEGLRHILALKIYSMLPDVLKRLLGVPYVLRRLALANFCSWTAVMTFNLFYTDFVGQAIYGGDPNAPEDSPLREKFDDGVRMGSWGLLLHCVSSALYAAFIERISSRFNLRLAYLFGMMSFAIAIFMMVFSKSIFFANICAALHRVRLRYVNNRAFHAYVGLSWRHQCELYWIKLEIIFKRIIVIIIHLFCCNWYWYDGISVKE